MPETGHVRSGIGFIRHISIHTVAIASFQLIYAYARDKLFRKGPLKCRRLVFSLVSGRRALETGGPSTVFRRSWYLPVYDKPVVRQLRLSKGDCASHGETFHFQRGRPRGRICICEATELSQIPDHALTSSSQAIAWSILQTPSAR